MAAVSAAERKRRSAPRKKKGKNALLVWWPLLLGIAVTPLTLHVAGILALEGTNGLRLLYPYVLLIKGLSFDLSIGFGDSLSQAMMYLQFPLYGLLFSMTLRSKGTGSAINLVFLLHLAGIFAVFAMGYLPGH